MAEKFLSLTGMQTLWNKVKSVFATKTDVNKKLDVSNVNLTGVTTTILAEVQAMAVNRIDYKRFFTSSDGGSANIPDKPTGTKNAGFVLEAICNRRNSANDYRYVLLCYVQLQKPKIAWVTHTTTSITWNNLDTTLETMSVDEGKTGTATTNRGLTAKNLKEIITNYLSQFEGNNIVNTYATKEALNSANQNIAGLTSGLGSKLQADGSNANSTTTNNIFEAAAGGASDSYTIEDNTQILLKDEGDTARKYYLSKFIDYLRSKLIRDSFSPPTSTNVAPTVGAVTTVIENKEKNLKETYFDAAPISISKDVETAILEIPYSSAPDLYQRIYELNISSNIAHQTNFKIIFCPAVNSSKSFTTNTRAYILGFSTDTTRGLFRFCTTNSGVVLTCKYTSDNSSSNTRQIAISMNIARGTGFTKVNKPITDYGTITSSFYLTNTTYVKSYVTSDDLDNKLYNTITEYNNGAFDAYGYASLPIVCKPYVYTAETTKSASEWITTCIPSSMITNGRSFILVNPSNVTYKISGLANSSTYSLNSNLSMIIVYCNNKYYRQTV